MKDFPNYLLSKTEKQKISKKHTSEHVWQPSTHKKAFQPSNVPSILQGITQESHVNYAVIREALRLQQSDLLLFANNTHVDHAFNEPNVSTSTKKDVKHTGLHRTLKELVAENEHIHLILTKGDNHER